MTSYVHVHQVLGAPGQLAVERLQRQYLQQFHNRQRDGHSQHLAVFSSLAPLRFLVEVFALRLRGEHLVQAREHLLDNGGVDVGRLSGVARC